VTLWCAAASSAPHAHPILPTPQKLCMCMFGRLRKPNNIRKGMLAGRRHPLPALKACTFIHTCNSCGTSSNSCGTSSDSCGTSSSRRAYLPRGTPHHRTIIFTPHPPTTRHRCTTSSCFPCCTVASIHTASRWGGWKRLKRLTLAAVDLDELAWGWVELPARVECYWGCARVVEIRVLEHALDACGYTVCLCVRVYARAYTCMYAYQCV